MTITAPLTTKALRTIPLRRVRVSARAVPTLVVLAASIAYLIAQPPSIDMSAAEYRAALFGHTGFAIWDLQWYGGHYLPAYSVLVPALSWLMGPRWLGVLCVVCATAFFQRLIRPRDRTALLAVAWFGLGVLASLCSGRVTFTAGIPVALAALLVERRGRPTAAPRAGVLALSALTALLSPVASLFLAVVWAALLITERRPFMVAALAATFAPILVLNLAFPEIGVEPMAIGALLWPAVFTGVMLALPGRRRGSVAAGLVIYLLACAVTCWAHSPVGSNVLRLWPLCAGPVALLYLRPRRTLPVVVLAGVLLAAQWHDAVSDIRTSAGNPTVHAAYYRPLLGYLDRVSGPAGEAAGNGFRIEIPFTELHWEARWVAPRFALARGWERQVDIADNPLFYRPGLTAAGYDRWLHADAVRYVALPATTLDPSARRERQIIRSRPSFLRLVWSDRDWQVYEVRRATPILDGRGRLRTLTSDAIGLTLPPHGDAVLRVRFNPYLAVVSGAGCVAPSGPWVRVTSPAGGAIRIGERFAPWRVDARSPRCSR